MKSICNNCNTEVWKDEIIYIKGQWFCKFCKAETYNNSKPSNCQIEMSVFCNDTDDLKWFDCANNIQEFLNKLNDDELVQDKHYFRIKKEG